MSRPSLLQTLYADCEGLIEFRTIRPNEPTGRYYFEKTDVAGIADLIRQHRGYNIYFAVATRDGKGGKKENIKHVPALWIDLDYKTLPGGEDEAERILHDFPLQPTIRVHSGGGLHLYWVLKEPAEKDEIEAVENVLKRLAAALQGDPACAEAAHILRVPNTQNVKYKPARAVVLQHCNGSRFSLSDFDFLPEVAEQERKIDKKEQGRNLAKIMACSFMMYCQDHAKDLPEPQWYAMISNLCREPGGIDLIHSISKPYSKYSVKETDRKILQAMNNSGPHKCAHIKGLWECGQTCSVASPAALAFKGEIGERDEQGEIGEQGDGRRTEAKERRKVGEKEAKTGEENLSELIRAYVSESSGTFTNTDIDKELGLKTLRERQQRSKVLNKLALEKICERMSKVHGAWRSKNLDYQPMQILGSDVSEFPVNLPLGLSKYIEINRKEIILISGENNAGKTAFIFSMMWDNIRHLQDEEKIREQSCPPEDGGIGIRYFSSEMGPSGVLKKLKAFGKDYPPEEFVRYVLAVERSRDFHDILDPDGINFIDYLEVSDGEYFKLASDLTLIHTALNNGVVICGLQKKKGTDIGRGGEATLEKPRLAIALSENKEKGFSTCKIIKAKHYRDKNPVGWERDYIVRRKGTLIQAVSDWGYYKEHQTRRNSTDYRDWE